MNYGISLRNLEEYLDSEIPRAAAIWYCRKSLLAIAALISQFIFILFSSFTLDFFPYKR